MRGWLIAAMLAAVAWILYRQSNGGTLKNDNDKLDAIARAIYDSEDASHSGLATRLNNPGNLKYAGQPGASPGDRGFAVFKTFDAGLEALKRQILLDARRNPEWSLTNFTSKYLGGDPLNPRVTGEGDPFSKASIIAGKIGATVSDTLGDLLGVVKG